MFRHEGHHARLSRAGLWKLVDGQVAPVRMMFATGASGLCGQVIMSGSLRILLVEDSRDALEALAKLLRHEGHEVHAAMTVREAVNMAERKRWDLLIADIGLPDGTAMELMSVLRNICPLPGIVLTGHGEDEYRAQSRAAGFRRHLLKPVVFPDLLAAIAEIENAGSSDSASAGGPAWHSY